MSSSAAILYFHTVCRECLAGLRHRHALAEHAGGLIPFERLRVIARYAGHAFAVDLAEPLRRLAVARARGAHIELHRVVALALQLEGHGLLVESVPTRLSGWGRRRARLARRLEDDQGLIFALLRLLELGFAFLRFLELPLHRLDPLFLLGVIGSEDVVADAADGEAHHNDDRGD